MLLALLIPAYQPDQTLLTVIQGVKSLVEQDPVLQHHAVEYVIVDDGSTSEGAKATFAAMQSSMPDVNLLRREVNGGQGASLKHGIAWIHNNLQKVAWLVTGDADGQHLPEDIIKIMRAGVEDPGKTPVFGTRDFDASVPLRSRFGNIATSRLVKLLYGYDVPDTQTGLRGIPPRLFATLMDIKANRFQFNSEVLLALLQQGALRKIKISTVYEPGNPSSHFRPLWDSLQIYAVLLRYALVMLLVAGLEFINFNIFSSFIGQTFTALALAKAISILISFVFLRTVIFRSNADLKRQIIGFLIIAAMHLFSVWFLINFLTNVVGFGLFLSAVLAYSIMFVVIFVLQRNVVFVQKAL